MGIENQTISIINSLNESAPLRFLTHAPLALCTIATAYHKLFTNRIPILPYPKTKIIANLDQLKSTSLTAETDLHIRELIVVDNFKRATGIECKKPMREALIKLYNNSDEKYNWEYIKSIRPFLKNTPCNTLTISIKTPHKILLSASALGLFTYTLIFYKSITTCAIALKTNSWIELSKSTVIFTISALALALSCRYIIIYFRASSIAQTPDILNPPPRHNNP